MRGYKAGAVETGKREPLGGAGCRDYFDGVDPRSAAFMGNADGCATMRCCSALAKEGHVSLENAQLGYRDVAQCE